MIKANPLLGTFYHGVGALSASTCYTPQKKVGGWSWHTYWLVQAFVCWLVLPIIGAAVTIPHLVAVLHASPPSAMRNAFLLGMAYGIGGTAFGLSIRYIGFSLTYSIAIGLSSVLGTIIPLLVEGKLDATFQKIGGNYILLGIMIGVIGIAVTGAAGRIKEIGLSNGAPVLPSMPATPGIEASSEATTEEYARKSTAFNQKFSLTKGLLLSLIAGVLSAVYSFALLAGQPIADVAIKYGAGVWQGNVVYIFANGGAFITTLAYCGFVILKDGSAREFMRLSTGHSRGQLRLNFLMAGLTGLLWYGQFFFYNLGQVFLGKYNFSGWSMHMTMLVLFSGLIAIMLREWRGCRRSAQFLFVAAMALLIIGIFALTYGNYIGNTYGGPVKNHKSTHDVPRKQVGLKSLDGKPAAPMRATLWFPVPLTALALENFTCCPLKT